MLRYQKINEWMNKERKKSEKLSRSLPQEDGTLKEQVQVSLCFYGFREMGI